MSSWKALWTTGTAAASWSRSEKAHNVDNIYNFFRRRGWTIEAMAGMLGNIEYESYINPGQWETGHAIYKGGFGLVQWTPYTKYSDWAGSDWSTNWNKQLERIQYELENEIQWISTNTYNFSFREYSKMKNSDMEYMAKAFEYCYERGTWNNARVENARYWYKYLKRKRLMFYVMFAQSDDQTAKGVIIK